MHYRRYHLRYDVKFKGPWDVIESGKKLFQVLRERNLEFAAHSFDCRPPPPFAGGDVWLLAALLQKAIRRGDLVVARRAGHQLLEVDPARVWRRLMVVALEDIGFGCPESAVALVGFSCLPELRRLVGGNGLALDIALRLGCEAVKDRSGDDFCSIAREMAGEPHSLDQASANARHAVLASTYLDWRRRLKAAQLLSEIEARAAERASAFAPAAEIYRALGVPDSFMDACEVYRFKACDPLPLFVPLACSLWLGQGSPRATLTHLLPPAAMIGEIPDYGFDPLHTRLGRRAVDLWLRSYLERPPFTAGQVAAALWIIESGACSKTLSWSLGAQIGEQAVLADVGRHGLHGFEGVKAWIEQERSVLTCARKAAWESASHRPLDRQGVLPLAAE